MEQKDKELLLKDLSARLPYGVCVELPNHHLVKHIYSIKSISMENGWTTGVLECAGRKKIYSAKIEDVKPYLRPMSSMTEEEKDYVVKHSLGYTANIGGGKKDEKLYFHFKAESYDWLNKKMFDFRGLIPKDLALSTETFNPYIED